MPRRAVRKNVRLKSLAEMSANDRRLILSQHRGLFAQVAKATGFSISNVSRVAKGQVVNETIWEGLEAEFARRAVETVGPYLDDTPRASVAA